MAIGMWEGDERYHQFGQFTRQPDQQVPTQTLTVYNLHCTNREPGQIWDFLNGTKIILSLIIHQKGQTKI